MIQSTMIESVKSNRCYSNQPDKTTDVGDLSDWFVYVFRYEYDEYASMCSMMRGSKHVHLLLPRGKVLSGLFELYKKGPHLNKLNFGLQGHFLSVFEVQDKINTMLKKKEFEIKVNEGDVSAFPALESLTFEDSTLTLEDISQGRHLCIPCLAQATGPQIFPSDSESAQTDEKPVQHQNLGYAQGPSMLMRGEIYRLVL